MSKWISVNKKLPESSDEVLTCSFTGKGEYFGIYVLYFFNDYWWRKMDGLWAFDVTHWMPLPKPPTKQEGEK